MPKINKKSIEKKPTEPLTVPIRQIADEEQLALGLRQEHITCSNGGVYSGAGVGSPWIILRWNDRTVVIHATELLASWVRTFNPEDAKRIDASTSAGGVEATVG